MRGEPWRRAEDRRRFRLLRDGRGALRRARRSIRRALPLGLGAAVLVIAACSSGGEEPAATPESATTIAGSVAASAGASAGGSYVLFNQRLIEGFGSDGIDLTQPDSVFAAVFASLPGEVTVYPSENYYYFILNVDSRPIWGNIRLPAGRREHGVLSFGYFEFIEFPSASPAGLTGSKFYTDADGVIVTEVDRFTYTVRFNGKTVTFRFHQLDQSTPEALVLGQDETFIQRTFDESGYQFYLLFNERANYFFWVLNEEQPVPDLLDPRAADLLVGRRSGFAFWVDGAHGDRKVLAAVRRLNIVRNDYYDGPFDQLADNYADETQVAAYMQRAFPSLQGRIDKYGYYTDRERPVRVALSTYFVYSAPSELDPFLAQLRQQDDPYRYISQRGQPSAAAQSEADADGA